MRTTPVWSLQAASERISRVAGVSGVARGVGLNDPTAVGEHGSWRPGWGTSLSLVVECVVRMLRGCKRIHSCGADLSLGPG